MLIVAAGLGYGELGCYGEARIRTPRIDQLAVEGRRFTQFYAGAPVCAPSRCVLLVGEHDGHAAARVNAEAQPEGRMTLPEKEFPLDERLREVGYRTGAFGRWGLGAPGSEGAPKAQGFDEFFGHLCQREAHNFYPDHLWRNQERVELAGAPVDPQLDGVSLRNAFNAGAGWASARCIGSCRATPAGNRRCGAARGRPCGATRRRANRKSSCTTWRATRASRATSRASGLSLLRSSCARWRALASRTRAFRCSPRKPRVPRRGDRPPASL